MKRIIHYPPGRNGKEYRIPNGVEIIDTYAFYKTFIPETLIIFSETITTIKSYAFSNCKVNSLVLSSSIQYCPRSAARNKSRITFQIT